MRFIGRNSKSDRKDAHDLILRAKVWDVMKKVIPRRMPSPDSSYLNLPWGSRKVSLRLDYAPSNEEAENLRRKIGAVLVAKDYTLTPWKREVCEYSGNITYTMTTTVLLPDFKGKEKLETTNKDFMDLTICIANGSLAKGCRLEKVEVVVPATPESKKTIYRSVCDEVENSPQESQTIS